MTTAAIFRAPKQPLEVRDDVVVASPFAGEVKVKMLAAGVCHTDLSIVDGSLMHTPDAILGHEGAAEITEVGEGVEGLKTGDRVVVSWVPQCGQCFYCKHGQPNLCERATAAMAGTMADGSTRAEAGGLALKQMAGTGTFASEAIIPAISLVGYEADVEPEIAALIGCGVLTGVGAALNTGRINPGDTVAVIGCGGVGLNVIQGALLAGAERVIAIDRIDSKLQQAKEFGATDLVNVSEKPAIGPVMGMTEQRGVDVCFEAIGLPQTIEECVQLVRRGGQAVIVGIPPADAMLNLPAFFGLVLAEKTIKGCWYGSADVRRDVPILLDHYASGRLRLDELVSARISIADVNQALDELRSGKATRSVIVY